MKSATIVAIVLGVLVVLSAIQAFQLNGLQEKVADGEFSIGSSTSTRPAATSSSDSGSAGELPASIQNLPTMVGGC